jgi:ferric-dicitrate binding protein FerR (iron transport regulator)
VICGRQNGRRIPSPVQARRRRNVMIALALGCGAILVYAVTILRFGSMNRPL